jgi:hypothetical protein
LKTNIARLSQREFRSEAFASHRKTTTAKIRPVVIVREPGRVAFIDRGRSVVLPLPTHCAAPDRSLIGIERQPLMNELPR